MKPTTKKRTKHDKKYLETLLRQACFTRDNYQCVRCNKTEVLQMSHVYPKGRYHSMEFELWNVKTLCLGCHLYWWHRNPLEASAWFQGKYPERAELLRKMSQDTNRPKFNYEKIKEELSKHRRDERPTVSRTL